jgi:hypothetical protein
VSQGHLELPRNRQAEAAGLPDGSTVVVRLREDGRRIECLLAYHDRNEDRAVFSRADWETAGWPTDAGELSAIQLRKRTGTDIARNAVSLRFLVVIAPIIIAIFAIGPGLIWPPPSTGASASQVAVANQLAEELVTAPHLSHAALAEVAALRAELRAAQASATSIQRQQHRYDVAYLLDAAVVAVTALAVAIPQVRGVLGFRAR